MKVGILTFHRADNYGAILQAYALQETIDKLGYEVEIINYAQPSIATKYKLNRINTKSGARIFIKTLLSTIMFFPKRYHKKQAFKKFRNMHLKVSSNITNNIKENSYYDIYITGSDQVWNPTATNFDANFFLNSDNDINTKKISYAASVGKDRPNKIEKEFIEKYINNIDFISVREQSAVDVIKKFTSNKIERVLDPTLLADKEIWEKFISTNKNGEYILVYTVGALNELLRDVKLIKEKYPKYKFIFITDKAIIKDKQYEVLDGITVERYLTLFFHAKFIITNSFHGTAFSLIFNKQFATLPHKTNGARMKELLELLELQDRLINGESTLDQLIESQVDYEEVNKLINIETSKSVEYLTRALQSKKT